jgi:ABC-type phosphate transport system substrate-binding protein
MVSTLLLAGLLLAAAPAEEQAFAVIVNAGNPVQSLTRSEVSRLFLKQASAWPTQEKARVVDLSEASPTRQAFSRAVLQRPVAAVTVYWQQMIFSGREVPPPKKSRDDEVIEFVARHPGGLGYVASSTPLPATVRVLTLRD